MFLICFDTVFLKKGSLIGYLYYVIRNHNYYINSQALNNQLRVLSSSFYQWSIPDVTEGQVPWRGVRYGFVNVNSEVVLQFTGSEETKRSLCFFPTGLSFIVPALVVTTFFVFYISLMKKVLAIKVFANVYLHNRHHFVFASKTPKTPNKNYTSYQHTNHWKKYAFDTILCISILIISLQRNTYKFTSKFKFTLVIISASYPDFNIIRLF